MFATFKWTTPYALVLLLAGCGGGDGVNSTPTPPPVGTPTPDPTPTPTPGEANADLMGSLKSETFTGDGANLSGQFRANGQRLQNAAATSASLTIAYEAATQSYTISTAGRSATFGPAERLTPDSPDFMSFQRTHPANEVLTMTRPGASGPLTYQYVSGGAWERITLTNDGFDFSYDPFTFGVGTADTALRRTGTGSYAVTLIGARLIDAPYAMIGDGTLQVDFRKGALSTSGTLTTVDTTGLIKADGSFFGEASLSSVTNAFSGDFLLQDGTRFTGGWSGRFYGPGSQEVGAAWQLTSADGQVAAGYLLGRQDGSIAPLNTSLTPLQFSDSFTHRFSQLAFKDGVNGAELSRSNGIFSVDPANSRFTYASAGENDTRFTTADRLDAASSNAVDVYRITGSDGLAYTLTLNKPGAGNPDIALTYASFGHWEKAQGASSDRLDRWFAWGIRTNGLQVPTGTGHFDGIIRGTAARFNGEQPYSLSGTSSFDMNFGTGNFTGSLNPIGTSPTGGAPRDFGTFSVANGKIDSNAGLNGDIVNSSNAWLGFFEGALFGPHATELGGSFGFQTNGGTPGSSTVMLSGVTVAKRTDP